jgi:aryl-phospho-beta-D-glucosidase BglC (GH1 family)
MWKGGAIIMQKWLGYQKGINLGGWFSQCDYSEERFRNFITEKDFQEFSTWGIDHVRIPIDYNLVETEDGEYKESGFAHINRAIDWCEKYGLNMILDLHKTAGYCFDFDDNSKTFFDDEALQQRFYRLWEELAKRYARYHDRLSFELLNEVTDPAYSEKWNAIARKAIQTIRRISKEVTILVGGYHNNAINALRDLDAPYDENIVYNFHCYEPLLFTHQHAYWIDELKALPAELQIAYPDKVSHYRELVDTYDPEHTSYFEYGDLQVTEFGEAYFEEIFADGLKVAEERNVRLYCGEYGVIDKADIKSTMNWYQDIHAVFERHGIGHAAWSYKEMDFGLSDGRMHPVLIRSAAE